MLRPVDDRQDRRFRVRRRPHQIGAIWRGDGPPGEVGVESGDDGGDVGAAGVDDGEVAGAGIVPGDEVEGHDDRGGVVDGEGLLVVGGAGWPTGRERGGRSGSRRHPCWRTSPGAGRGAPGLHAAGGIRGQIRFRGGVGQLIHGQVHRMPRPGDELIYRPIPDPDSISRRNDAIGPDEIGARWPASPPRQTETRPLTYPRPRSARPLRCRTLARHRAGARSHAHAQPAAARVIRIFRYTSPCSPRSEPADVRPNVDPAENLASLCSDNLPGDQGARDRRQRWVRPGLAFYFAGGCDGVGNA